jgi:hypothetical protein
MRIVAQKGVVRCSNCHQLSTHWKTAFRSTTTEKAFSYLGCQSRNALLPCPRMPRLLTIQIVTSHASAPQTPVTALTNIGKESFKPGVAVVMTPGRAVNRCASELSLFDMPSSARDCVNGVRPCGRMCGETADSDNGRIDKPGGLCRGLPPTAPLARSLLCILRPAWDFSTCAG